MMRLYHGLGCFLHPFIWLWIHYRQRIGKEDAVRIAERFGYGARPRPDGLLIWVHAASVGESMSVLTVIREIITRLPSAQIMLTTGTVTSAHMMQSRLPDRAFHHYVPVDTPPAVNRFLAHFKPDMAIWVESELWPNLIAATHRRAIPMLLINARLSVRSAQRWQKFQLQFHLLLACFETIFAGSEADAERFRQFGHSDIRYGGNLKYDADPLPVNQAFRTALVQQIADRPFWVAASTHADEEERVAAIHRQLRQSIPNLLSILVPRHPERAADIMDVLAQQALQVAVHSRGEAITADTDMYLLDVMGELGTIFDCAKIVFIGGSLAPCGGHNPIEPAQYHCAVICGPYMENFAMVADELSQENGLIQVAGDDDLLRMLAQLLQDGARCERHASGIARMVMLHKGVADQIVQRVVSQFHQERAA